MVDACKLLGVDVMTGHWELTHGMARVKEIVEKDFKGKLVVVLSHNGMDVDLKLASRVRGIDAVFGGHMHDGVPVAVPVNNAGGTTLVTNAGSNGKCLGLMDFDVRGGRLVDFRYRLLPIFASRGNFNGSWDQRICDATMDVQGAEIALSPGFRWGTSRLPGDTLTRELMMDQLAITCPRATISEMTGETIKAMWAAASPTRA